MTTTVTTKALWITAAGQAEHRDTIFDLATDHLPVKTLYTGISRGTERLVLEARVPASEHATMRAPFQEGDFTFPVKYGYAAVGQVEQGDRAGDTVFALFPHQARFALPEDALIPVPEDVPAHRAVLAANMETALNIVWDAGLRPGDTVAVVGCGVVGALTAYLAARIPGTEVCAVDTNPSRAALAKALGFGFSAPNTAPGEADVVIHTSATSDGLAASIALAGLEASVVEASWYGEGMTPAPLGGRFHQRRLKIIGSQVGRIPATQAPRWTYRRRLEKAMSLLADPALDALLTGETPFADLPKRYSDILSDPETLCHRVRYSD